MIKYASVILLLISSVSAMAQESILKDFAEDRRDFKICLYPSTLRMVNINKDPEFYELVNDVQKLLIYKLDSATTAEKEYTEWTNAYLDIGYEEYITMRGKVNLTILGKKDEFVGLTGAEDGVIAFYLRGEVAFQKIPTLIQKFEGGNMLSMISNQLDRRGR